MLWNSTVSLGRSSRSADKKRRQALVILLEYDNVGDSLLFEHERPSYQSDFMLKSSHHNDCVAPSKSHSKYQGGGYVVYCQNKSCVLGGQELLGKSIDNGETTLCTECGQQASLRCTCGFNSFVPFDDRRHHQKINKCKFELRTGDKRYFDFEKEVKQTTVEGTLSFGLRQAIIDSEFPKITLSVVPNH